jgi:hypothetical protein
MNLEHLKCCGNCKHIEIHKCYRSDCSNHFTDCEFMNNAFPINLVCPKWEFDGFNIFERLNKL